MPTLPNGLSVDLSPNPTLVFGFFKDKSNGPREVTCPLCQRSQQESPLAVSSYCKGCGAYLSFRKDGEIVARAQATPDPFAHRPKQPKVEIEYKPREEKIAPAAAPKKEAPKEEAKSNPAALPTKPEPKPAPKEKEPELPAINESEPPEPAPEPKPESEPEPKAEPEPKPELQAEPSTSPTPPEPSEEGKPEELDESNPRYQRATPDDDPPLKKVAANERLATCFECGDAHIANALANSTQCRKCGRLISLEDQHIREALTNRIQTRGNVYIHKKGIVLGASIQCHNLIVEGDFTGSAECSGDLTLRRHGKIIGKVICDRLLVEKRAKVEFLNLVQANECKIDGLVTGNLACRGLLALEKRATLTGDIKVGTLTVADGAKHTGKIQMGGF